MPNRASVMMHLWAILATAFVVVTPATARAQATYPSRPIKFVVPVPPGNMLDTMPRLIGEKLTA